MAKSKEQKAPTTAEVVVVEDTQVTPELELEVQPTISNDVEQEEIVYHESSLELTKFEKQLGLTVQELLEWGTRAQLKHKFASIMESMHNYHMSCESKNDARYKDIMNHILTSCELASTFVR